VAFRCSVVPSAQMLDEAIDAQPDTAGEDAENQSRECSDCTTAEPWQVPRWIQCSRSSADWRQDQH